MHACRPLVFIPAVFLATLALWALLSLEAAGSVSPLQPDLQVEAKYLSRYRIVSSSGQKLLMFDTGIGNKGAGAMELWGNKNASGDMVAYQRIYNDDGSHSDQAVGTFEYDVGDGHNHYHYRHFVQYELQTLEGTTVVSGPKASFCLLDLDKYTPPLSGAPKTPVYSQCNQGDLSATSIGPQGISRGWIDVYSKFVAGQSLNVTGLPPGNYRLVAIANPDGLLSESDPNNNEASVIVKIR